MNRLSRAHKATILAVLAHLSRLATHHEATSFMNASNLGLCFAPCFFGIDEETMPDPSIVSLLLLCSLLLLIRVLETGRQGHNSRNAHIGVQLLGKPDRR